MDAPTPVLVVAMDGPSGSGKSSVSREVADILGLRYLDTGAMYRAMTWWMLREGVDIGDPEAVAAVCGRPTIVSGTDPLAPTITVDGIDVSIQVRSREVTNAVSAVSAVPAVRTRLVAQQRAIIARSGALARGIVVEGRDIGTVVAPDAAVKMYLTASADARADRRTAENALTRAGVADLGTNRADMARRDRLDSTRAVAPLLKAVDAVDLDTTELSKAEVVAIVVGRVRAVLGELVAGDLAR